MKKIVLFSFVIFYLFNVLNAFTAEKNNNNNIDNKNNNNVICPKLLPELWGEIIEQLINSNTIPELKKSMIAFCQLRKSSKLQSQLATELLRKKLKLEANQPVTIVAINDFYIQRKNEIINGIKKKLENSLPNFSFAWFNDINAKNNNGRTALIVLVDWINNPFGEHIELIELLIKNGADVDCQDNNGLTALMHSNNKETIDLLIKKGANVNKTNSDGLTALMFASLNNRTKIAELLIQNGANVNAKIKKDAIVGTALAVAAREGFKEMVRLLLKYGAEVNAKTALEITSLSKHKEIVQLIQNYKKQQIKSDVNSYKFNQ